MSDSVEYFSLADALSPEWIKLPAAAMRDVGPAAQTLGGLLAISSTETFVAASKIAARARVPLATARKHLVTLENAGYVTNKGRQQARSGHARRTCTLAITNKARDAAADRYHMLPWWSCCNITTINGRLPWSSKAVLSVIISRICSLKAGAEREDVDSGVEACIDHLGGPDRFQFSLTTLERLTGLTRDSIATAKRHLAQLKLVDWIGDGIETDTLYPNWDFQVAVTSLPNNRCLIAFDSSGSRNLVNI